MVSSYMEKDVVTKLDNKELISKQQDINAKLARASVRGFPVDLYNDMIKLRDWIEAEIDARLDDGRMDEDELEDDF